MGDLLEVLREPALLPVVVLALGSAGLVELRLVGRQLARLLDVLPEHSAELVSHRVALADHAEILKRDGAQ